MFSVSPAELPGNALLAQCRDNGEYTDCYSTSIPGAITHEQFVAAFYTTMVFRLERLILKLAVGKPSTDSDAIELADGSADSFAAWNVERRSENQILLTDFSGRTRSWLMVKPVSLADGVGTRLYFGSAIVPKERNRDGKAGRGLAFSALLGFHKLYSIVLLAAARSRLKC